MLLFSVVNYDLIIRVYIRLMVAVELKSEVSYHFQNSFFENLKLRIFCLFLLRIYLSLGIRLSLVKVTVLIISLICPAILNNLLIILLIDFQNRIFYSLVFVSFHVFLRPD